MAASASCVLADARGGSRYYVLITPKGSGNSACCFTTLGHQDAGSFGMKGDALSAIGKLEMNVFRSFACVPPALARLYTRE